MTAPAPARSAAAATASPGFQPVVPQTTGTLLMYTDGASEALNEHDEQFGEQGLLRALSTSGGGTAEEATSGVLHAIEAFRDDSMHTDDLTLLACQRCP